MNTTTLHARNTDPTTSHAAAASATAKRARCRAQVRQLLAEYPEGMTLAELVNRHELRADFGPFQQFSDSGIRTRVRELADDGEVLDTGRKRRMASGRYGIVWALNPEATSAPHSA